MKIPFLIDTEEEQFVVFEESFDLALDVAMRELDMTLDSEDYIDVTEFNTFDHGDTRDYRILG